MRAGQAVPSISLKLEKKLKPSGAVNLFMPVISITLALIFGAVFLLITGHNPLEVYVAMFSGALGSAYGISETVVQAIPLMLCGLGVSLAFRLQLWNIGAEGQLYMGAFAAGWLALTFPDWPVVILLPAIVVAGFLGGAIWGLIPAIPRAYLGVNEVITTLMLNYIAILWVDYLVYGPWKDPNGYNFPLTASFSPSAVLPTLGNTRIHLGLLFALIAAVILYIILQRSKWGYEIRVIGESPSAARYAGMNIKRNILLVMLISGGLAGLAGMAEACGVAQRLQHALSPGYGYTAIIVAWLGKLNPTAIVFISLFFGGLQVGGYSVQSSGVPAAVAAMLQGLILFFVLGGEIFTRYKLSVCFQSKKKDV